MIKETNLKVLVSAAPFHKETCSKGTVSMANTD